MQKKMKKTLLFSASVQCVQHVKNVDMMVQCDECGQWRLLYSNRKLKHDERWILVEKLNELIFMCGSSLEDLDLQGTLKEVYI